MQRTNPKTDELEAKISSWFDEYLQFPRVLPVTQKVVFDEQFTSSKRSLSFGHDNGKELVLSPSEVQSCYFFGEIESFRLVFCISPLKLPFVTKMRTFYHVSRFFRMH